MGIIRRRWNRGVGGIFGHVIRPYVYRNDVARINSLRRVALARSGSQHRVRNRLNRVSDVIRRELLNRGRVGFLLNDGRRRILLRINCLRGVLRSRSSARNRWRRVGSAAIANHEQRYEDESIQDFHSGISLKHFLFPVARSMGFYTEHALIQDTSNSESNPGGNPASHPVIAVNFLP